MAKSRGRLVSLQTYDSVLTNPQEHGDHSEWMPTVLREDDGADDVPGDRRPRAESLGGSGPHFPIALAYSPAILLYCLFCIYPLSEGILLVHLSMLYLPARLKLQEKGDLVCLGNLHSRGVWEPPSPPSPAPHATSV